MKKNTKIDRKQKAFLKALKEKFSEDPGAVITADDEEMNFFRSVMIPHKIDRAWRGVPHHPTLLPSGPWEL